MSRRVKICLLLICVVILIWLIGRQIFWQAYFQPPKYVAPAPPSQGAYLPYSSHGVPLPPLTGKGVSLVAEIREAGLKRDRSKLPLVRESLQVPHPFILISALLAAGRLGDIESIPKIENLQDHHDERVRNLAKVIPARIRAENTVHRIASTNDLLRKVNHFMSEVRFSKARIEEGARAFKTAFEARKVLYPPPEVYALRCIADFVAEASEAGVVNAASLVGFDFSQDYAAQLKVRLASMPKSKKIDWLIEFLARKKTVRYEDYYAVRALADEGIDAVKPILAKLKSLRTNRQGYFYAGISTLFETLDCIGDRSAIPILRDYLNDPDPNLRHYAQQSIARIERGYRTPYNLDY